LKGKLDTPFPTFPHGGRSIKSGHCDKITMKKVYHKQHKKLKIMLNRSDMKQKENTIKLLMKCTTPSPLGEGWEGG